MDKSTLSLGIVALLLVGASAGYIAREYVDPTPVDPTSDEEIRLGIGRFTNPLLECNAADGTLTSPKQDFKPQLDTFITELAGKTKSISKIAVSYRDLNNGPSFGVNRDDAFFPASLLKVPVMMAYFKHAAYEPGVLNEVLTFTPQIREAAGDVTQEIPPEKQLAVGQSYTVKELIEQMIKYSDNHALMMLSEKLSQKEYTDLFKQLGVDTSVISDPSRTLSARQYSTFFRILYNASYLTQEYSEEALRILSDSVFTKGLRAGIPASIPISHKFGERVLASGEKQLHDCGIVYYPKHPFLLCVMTRGNNIEILEDSVAKIGTFVYGKVDEQYHADIKAQ